MGMKPGGMQRDWSQLGEAERPRPQVQRPCSAPETCSPHPADVFQPWPAAVSSCWMPIPPAPSRCVALPEISGLGSGKIYSRRARRDPHWEAEDGISSLHLVQLKNLAQAAIDTSKLCMSVGARQMSKSSMLIHHISMVCWA